MRKFLVILLTAASFALVGCMSQQQLQTVETDIGLAVSDANQALSDLKDHPELVNQAEVAVQVIADHSGPLQQAATNLVKVFELYKQKKATIDQVQAALDTFNTILTSTKQVQARKAKKG